MTTDRTMFAAGFVCLLFVAPAASGCADPTAPTPDDFELTSDAAAGVLARIDYHDGGSVEFLRVEGGVFIGATFEKAKVDPLRGVRLGRVLPSELFAYLTGRQAQAELVEAEREAGLTSNPAAFTSLERTERAGDGVEPNGAEHIGEASSALTRPEFEAAYCFSGIDFCGPDLAGNIRIKSGGRIDATDGYVDVHSDSPGALRIRVRRDKVIGGWDTLSTAVVNVGSAYHFANATGVERHMDVVVDFAEAATYNLSVDFID